MPPRYSVLYDQQRLFTEEIPMAIGGWIGLLDDIAALAKLSAASLDDVSVAAGRATEAGRREENWWWWGCCILFLPIRRMPRCHRPIHTVGGAWCRQSVRK
ncbi:DUF808 family protein [Vreelandella stevensii]|uniref:DUF808 family protein n=1 Tax=Vreelandella stevensii TaxID=502821 RepID=UPI003079629F